MRIRLPFPSRQGQYERDSGFYDDSGSQPPRRRGRILWLPLLLVGLFIFFQYLSAEKFVNPETGEAARVGISSDQEAALGLQSFKEVLSQSRTLDSGPQVELVRSVAQKLIKVVDPESQKFEWMVSVVENDQINAFCLPGGKIVVYTGILPVAQSADGLATVMGHEIAHATARHGAQRMFQQGLVQTAMLGANFSLGEMDPQQRRVLLGALGAGVQFGLLLPYGRDHEYEADKIGLKYMYRAGFDPYQAVSFWERMAEAAGGAQPPEWMSTHPSHGSRIEQLRRLIPEVIAEGK